MNLKKILKALKLNESTVSMILGALVIVVVGVLIVNYFRGQESGTTLPSGVTSEIEGLKSLPAKHTVAEGETLWKISEDYFQSGYNWVDIAQENKLSDPGLIEAGQVLTIPNVEAKGATVSNPITTDQISITGSTYTVSKGDSLWNIAVRAYGDGYKWVEIARENKLLDPNVIHVGNILILPR